MGDVEDLLLPSSYEAEDSLKLGYRIPERHQARMTRSGFLEKPAAASEKM